MYVVANVCLNVLIYGTFGWAIMRWLGYTSQARTAGLFLAVGFAVGSFGGHAGTESEELLLLRLLGSVLGIAIISALLLLKRASPAHNI